MIRLLYSDLVLISKTRNEIQESSLGENMTDQNLLDRVRSKTITSLERSIRIYTKDGTKRWLNESVTRTLITALRDKTPIKIVAPFWAEHLYDVLTDEGLEQGSQEYRETWHNIEEGK